MEIKRLSVRSEQMEVMQAVAAANFERKLSASIRREHSDAIIRTPDGAESKVGDLKDEKLADLVHSGVIKAKNYQLSYESSIAGFVALMFEVAPSFDRHRLCEVLLGDEEKTPDARIEELLHVLTEKNWEAIRRDYDPQAWIVEEAAAPAQGSEDRSPVSTAAPEKEPEQVSAETFMTKTKRMGKTKIDALKTRSGTDLPADDIDADTVKIKK